MSLLSNILKKIGLAGKEAETIAIPAGFSSKNMAKRLGGDEKIGEKFYSGQHKVKGDHPNPTGRNFESDIVLSDWKKPDKYFKRVNNRVGQNQFDDSIPDVPVGNKKRNIAIAGAAGLAGLGGLGGYMLNKPDEDEILKNFFAKQAMQRFSGF
jgi:hypothetical protein